MISNKTNNIQSEANANSIVKLGGDILSDNNTIIGDNSSLDKGGIEETEVIEEKSLSDDYSYVKNDINSKELEYSFEIGV